MLKKQCGFGLIEVLLTIAIAAIMIILTTNYYSNVHNTQKNSRLLNQLHGISETVNRYIVKNPGTDLSKVFNGDITNNAAVNIDATDKNNLWQPGKNYPITVTRGTCYSIKVIVSGMPLMQCEKIKDSFFASFGSGASVSCTASKQHIFHFCSNKTD